ncbi:MAG TPA: hypothetical protein VGM99_00885 [Candidatus Cybelea sp.]
MNGVLFGIVLAVTLAQAAPAPVYHVPAPAVHAAPPPAARGAPAPVMHPAPVYHPAPAPVYHPAPAPVYHPVRAPAYHAAPVYHSAPAPVRSKPAATHFYAPNASYASGPYRLWRGPVVGNPRRWRWWAWNRYAIWYPDASYWGGGFWGRWSMLNPPALYGSVADYDDRQLFASYDVAPQSPGAQLLSDYGLMQTPCGPSNLVVIWGPDNSVICAYPNGLVGPGNYELDPATLTLRSL